MEQRRAEGAQARDPAVVRVRVLTSGDIAACPKLSLSPEHYRDDRTCRCGERDLLDKQIAALEEELRDGHVRLRALKEARRTA